MKKVFYYSFLAILLSISSTKSFATHAAGMDLTYECLGSNQYHFLCTFYRDCHGVNAPDSVILHITSTCGFNNSYIMEMIFSTQGSDSISYLAGLCPSETSECVGGTSPGYEQYIYEVTVTLNQPCANYTCGVGVMNRNAAITNLQNPQNFELYVECHLNNTNSLCNNSPVFTNIPLAYGCIDQFWTYNHGTFDPDGDSLVYELVQPLGGPGQPLQYAFGSGFTATHPMATTGAFNFNSATGQMGATASYQQVVVISVRITEYRNGVNIGTSQRDLQVIFQTCTDNVPSIPFGIFGVFGGTAIDSSHVTVCPGDNLQFSIIGSDPDAGQVLTMMSNISQVIPAATFTTIGSNPILGSFAWQTQPSDTGIYVFTLTITDDACPIAGQGVYSFTIIVAPLPVDAGSDTTICASNATVQLHANGTAPFQWSNGQYLNDSTSQNPIATLPGPGVYSFTLTGAVGDACENRDSIIVTVTPGPSGTIDASPDSVCVGDTVQLSAQGSGGTGTYTYQWTSIPSGFNSSQQNVTANPNSTIDYIVTITSGNCTFKDTAHVVAVALPSANFTVVPALQCASAPVTITYTGGSGNNFTWDFDGGNIISGSGSGPYTVQWQNAGTDTVKLTVTNSFGCLQSFSVPVTVNALPVASFTSNQTGCAPLTVNFQNTSTLGNTYTWSFGDSNFSGQQNPTHIYSAGTYDVILIATSAAGCHDTLVQTQYITAIAPPIAGFNIVPNEICANVPLTITYTGDTSSAYNYNWDFAGGIVLSGSGSGPFQVYWPNGLNDSVTLTVTDTTSCFTTISQNIIVDALPQASFDADNAGCAPFTVTFQNTSSLGSTYTWYFGDGDTSNLQSPTHTYGIGTYTVGLIVTSAAGCRDTVVLPNYITVDAIPDASFNIIPTELCAVNDVATISYTGIGGNDLQYAWNFGGGTVISGSGAGPYSVSWANGGTHVVSLTVTDTITGCTFTQSVNEIVDALPVASFTANYEGCAPLTVNFQNTSAGGSSYFWDLGNGNTSTQQNPSDTYNVGNYDVTLIVTSAAGCADTLTINEYINTSIPSDPSFTIAPTEVCVNEAVGITYTGGGGSDLTYTWNFDSGNILSGNGSGPYNVNWQTAGTYFVILTVTDSNTCASSDTNSVTIDPLPTADFSANAAGCDPVTVDFQNNSSLGVSYWWDLGNGTTSTQLSPSETYSTGTYDVTLIVTSADGCTDTLTQSQFVTVLADPIADFSITEPYNVAVDESQATYDFVNLSQNATSWYWDFGDGTTSTEENPQHHYSALDTFEVTLIACNTYCCDTFTLGKIIVVSYDEIYFPNAFSPNGDGANDVFHELGQLGIVSLHYTIYNRWGRIVFETTDINGAWDGTYKGEPAEVGAYVYVADAFMINGHELIRKGNITLVR